MNKSGPKTKFTFIILCASFCIVLSQSSCAAEKDSVTPNNLMVEIISPKEGEKVHGEITIEARVNHPEAIDYCDFYIQEPGAKDRYGWRDYSPPYFWGGDGQQLDTTMFDDGQASMVVYVYLGDNRESKVQQRVHFIIDNGKPEVKIRSPQDHEIVKGNILIHIDAIDRRGRNQAPGIVGISLYLDGSLQQRLTHTPFQTIVNMCLLTPGAHSVRVVAEDTDGLINAESIVIVIENNSGSIIGDNISQ